MKKVFVSPNLIEVEMRKERLEQARGGTVGGKGRRHDSLQLKSSGGEAGETYEE